jgi:hypothetical protein
MGIDRRTLLGSAAAVATTVMVGKGISALEIGPSSAGPDASFLYELHPLTRSLIERARLIGRRLDAPDRGMVERVIRQFADSSGSATPPVIKRMDTPTDAFDHLSRFGLGALLDMGTATFCRGAQPPASRDEDEFERAFEVRMLASELLGVDENDRILMAPKLRAKSGAMSANRSDAEVFRVRAVSSQISWLETSMAEAAAQAISNVELLLGSGASEASVAIDNQLMTIEAHGHGLLATWETPDALICVPRPQILAYPPNS